MKREEQAKKECNIVISDDMEYGTPFAIGFNKGVEIGVKWADSHAQWHRIDYTDSNSYLNTTPANEIPVIVAFRYHDHDTVYIEIATFSSEGKGKVYNGPGIVLAWMELPHPPKFN